MTPIDPRELTADERELLRFLLGHATFPGAHELTAQVDDATVMGGLPTLLELEVPPTAVQATTGDGVAPIRAFVYDRDGEVEGEVMVWVKGGYLAGLEYAWSTDEVPTAMPRADRVRLNRGCLRRET